MNGATSHWLAILNPASGRGRAARFWKRLRPELAAAGAACDFVPSASPGDGSAIARSAVLEGRRHILIVGGDGSASDVVNGVMDAGLSSGDPVTLAIAPCGTGNDWARGLGMPRRPRAIARAIARGQCVAHDVGLLEWGATGEAPAGRRWFVNVGGAGFDAWVLSRIGSAVASRLTYVSAAVRGLPGYRPAQFTLLAESEDWAGPLLTVFVAIGPYCGGGMHVAPGARADDGLFDVVAIRHPGMAGLLRRLPKLYSGALLRDPLVRHRRVASLRIESTPPGGVQLDGHVITATPAHFRCQRAAIRVVLGGEAGRRGRDQLSG